MPPRRPTKRDVTLALLQQSPSVFVTFDPRQERVIIPPHLRREPKLVLQYGMNMPVPIPDLDVGTEGIGATLSFGRVPCWTFIPWTAIIAVIAEDERHGMVWEEDIPHDLRVVPRTGAPQPDASKKPALSVAPSPKKPAVKRERKRPALRAVDGGHPTKAGTPRATATKPRLIVERKAEVTSSARPEPEAAPQAPRASDEIVELPTQEKKKRELPPYLRVVK